MGRPQGRTQSLSTEHGQQLTAMVRLLLTLLGCPLEWPIV